MLSVLQSIRKKRYRRSVQKREAMLQAMPHKNLTMTHTANGQLLPDRAALLDRMPKGAIVLEAGVAEGDFSAEILKRTEPEKLHLVDVWDSERYGESRGTVFDKFDQQISDGLVQIDEGLSIEMLPKYDDAYFDWIYIDTDHTYQTTADELALCDRIVKPGGRICGHDFCTGSIAWPVVYGVVQAVNEFCMSHHWQFEYVSLESHGHFSFCIKRL